ncbi:MAG: hypothetical protein VX874_21345 [Pseudomonadota bacterium]|nr:hypothetical protein [Pseudomonadota bacterium]
MRIASNRPDRLAIEHRPRSLMLLLAALSGGLLAIAIDVAWHGSFWALVPLALALALAFAVRFDFLAHTTVTFDRTLSTVDLVWLDQGGVTRRTLPLAGVERAEIDTIRSHDGPAITRTVLIVGTRRHQLTRAFMPGPTPARAAQAINDWLDR